MSKQKPLYPLYPLNCGQSLVAMQEKYSLKKSVDNIPFLFTFENEIDFDKMEEALDIEIARNDCFRAFGMIENKELKTYFIPEFHYGKVPRVDFRGKTAEKQLAYFQKLSNTPLDYKKKCNFRVVFAIGFDGKYLLYFAQHHIFNDTMGIMIAMEDLLNVYTSLVRGTELPKPLGSFEEFLKDYPSKITDEVIESGTKFYSGMYDQTGEPAAIAPYSGRFLDDYRKKVKNPEIRHAMDVSLIGNVANLKKMVIRGDEAKRIFDFCDEHNVSFQTFQYMLTRLQRSIVNHGEIRVLDTYTCGNRSKLSEKRTCGCVVFSVPFITAYEDDMKLTDALTECNNLFQQMYRHRYYDTKRALAILDEKFPHPPMNGYLVGTTSVVPMIMDLPDEAKCTLDWIPPQTQPSPLFTVVGYDQKNSYICWYQSYLLKFAKPEEIDAMFASYRRLISVMLDGSDSTLGEIMKKVQE